jgi:cytochrome P450
VSVNIQSEVASDLRRIDDLPGPKRLPLIGNLHQLNTSRLHLDMERWAREFGPVYRFFLGPQQVVVVADHELVNNMLKERPNIFRRAAKMTDTLVEGGVKLGLFNAEGERWQQQRRMVMSCFSPPHVRSYFPPLLRVAQRLRGRWATAAQAGEYIELMPDLMRFTIDSVSGLTFGQDTNTVEGGEDVIQKHLAKMFPAWQRRIMSPIPYWRYFKLPSDREVDRSIVAINQIISDYIAQARERLRADPSLREKPKNLVEAMIVGAEEVGSQVNDDDIAGNMLTMLLAGEDTTASSLAWMIELLYRNPAALQMATQEVLEKAPDINAMTIDQVNTLDYLEACAQEAMRLKPAAPFIPLETLEDTVLGDVFLPKGSAAWAILRHDCINPNCVPDPHSFKPERWLDSHRPQANEVSVKRVSMPFGSGTRVCPGRYLSLLEMKMALAMLLGHFEIADFDTPSGGLAEETLVFSMVPVGQRMRLRERG